MKHKTFKQWHYASLGRKFAPHLSGYNAGHLADAWQYQEKRIKELEAALLEADKGLRWIIETPDCCRDDYFESKTARQTRKNLKPILEEIKK